MLCDNESFLDAPASLKACARANVELWHIPARSPDLNPVERYWAWVRKVIRKQDLADLQAKKPPLDKNSMKARVKALLNTQAAKRVAKNNFFSLRKTCQLVDKKRGAHSGL